MTVLKYLDWVIERRYDLSGGNKQERAKESVQVLIRRIYLMSEL